MKQNLIEETIEIPAGIKASQNGLMLLVEGPKGKVQRKLEPKLGIELKP
jgi:ribosomal protein L6P/L9E